jgi:hypothetical protein
MTAHQASLTCLLFFCKRLLSQSLRLRQPREPEVAAYSGETPGLVTPWIERTHETSERARRIVRRALIVLDSAQETEVSNPR